MFVTFENDVTKKFENNETKLVSLLKGNKTFSKVKLSNKEVTDLVEELIKERREENASLFKQKAKALIDSKIQFEKFVKQKEKEFQEAITEKLKEFNKEMEDTFSLVEDIEELRKTYEETLQK